MQHLTLLKIALFLALCLGTTPVFSAVNSAESLYKEKATLTFGLLKGGSTIFGVEFEHLLSDHVGIQGGIGFMGFSGALNYHFKPSIKSSFLTLELLNQGGAGNNVWLRTVGAGYVHRGRWFAGKLGLGFPITVSEELDQIMMDRYGNKTPPVLLTYSVGVYFAIN